MVATTKERKYGRDFWREYLDKLYTLNEAFKNVLEQYAIHYLNKNVKIEIVEKFDLISFLRSYRVVSELIWPTGNGLIKQYEAFKKGKCKKLDFKLVSRSQNKSSEESHSVLITYEPYNFKGKFLFFPSKVIHSCERTDYCFISFGYVPIVCKHIYSSLRKVAEESESKNIPIDATILSPIPGYVWDVIRVIENKKLPILERMRETYFKLLSYILLNSSSLTTQKFVWSIIRINKTIKYLKFLT